MSAAAAGATPARSGRGQVGVGARAAGAGGAVALLLLAIPLAAPGPELVPARSGGDPGWLLGPFGEGLGVAPGLYLALLGSALVAWIAILAGAAAVGPRVVAATIGVALLAFCLAPPLLSQDVFSYIAYGRLGAEHGLNPYSATPAEIPEDPVLAFVGWRDAVSAYGPAFTLLTYPLGLLGVPAALWALKLLSAAAVALCAALTATLAARRGIDPSRAAAFVALNPLVLVHVVGGAHNDALLAAGLVGGVLAIESGMAAAGGGALVLAAGVKVSAAFALPFAALRAPRRRRAVAGMGAALAVLLAASLTVFGSEVGSLAGLAGENQARTSHYSVPSQLSRVTGIDVEALRLIALGGFAVSICGLLAWTWRGADWVRAAGWAGMSLLLATSWLLPWYLIWVLPLVAVSRDRALIMVAVALTGFQLVNRIPL